MHSFISSISKVDIAYCIKIKTTKTAYKKTFMKWFPVIHSKICMESVQTDFKTRLDRKPNINSLGNAFFIWFFLKCGSYVTGEYIWTKIRKYCKIKYIMHLKMHKTYCICIIVYYALILITITTSIVLLSLILNWLLYIMISSSHCLSVVV